MADPSAVLGTIDVVASYLFELAQRYRDWREIPDKCSKLSDQCSQFAVHLQKVKTKVDQSTVLDDEIRQELNIYLQSTNDFFAESLTSLQDVDNELRIPHHITHVEQIKAGVSGHTKKLFSCVKNFAKNPVKTVKSFSKVNRVTDILDAIEQKISDEKQIPLSVTTFLYNLEHGNINQSQVKETFNLVSDNPNLPNHCFIDPNIRYIKEALLNSKTETDITDSSINLSKSLTTPSDHLISICAYGDVGTGKTVALQAICRDEEIQKHFKDGIYAWTLHETANKERIMQKLASYARHLGKQENADEILTMKTVSQAAQKASFAFKGQRILFVVDNAENTDMDNKDFINDIRALISRTCDGALLFSTCDQTMFEQVVMKVRFEHVEAKGAISRSIIEACLRDFGENVLRDIDDETSTKLDQLLELCNGWKLCLVIAGLGIAESVRSCDNNICQGLEKYTGLLPQHGGGIEHAAEYAALFSVVKMSLKQCERWVHDNMSSSMPVSALTVEEMFQSLYIVDEVKGIPVSVVTTLWGLETENGRKVIELLARMNLIHKLRMKITDAAEKANENEDWEYEVRLPRPLASVSQDLAKSRDRYLEGWHKELLNSFILVPVDISSMYPNVTELFNSKITCRKWWKVVNANEKYIIRNVARHLVGAGLSEELILLLCDVRWTLRRRLYDGWSGLEKDFNRALDACETSSNEDEPTIRLSLKQRKGIKVLRDKICKSWEHISQNEHAIGFEIFGRATQADLQYSTVTRYLKSVETYCPKPWLRPTTAVLDEIEIRRATRSFVAPSINRIQFNLDGSRVVCGLTDLTVRVWDVKSGQLIGQPLKGHNGWLQCVDLNNDGTLAVSGSSDKTVRVWNVELGTPVGKPLKGHSGTVNCVAFNKDCSRVASGAFDKTIRIWDVEMSCLIGQPMRAHSLDIECVSFSVSGTKLVSGSKDKTICVWNVETGKMMKQALRGHEKYVCRVRFSFDELRVISASKDETLRMWDIESETQIGDPLFFERITPSFDNIAEMQNDGKNYYINWLKEQLELLLEEDEENELMLCIGKLHLDVHPILEELGFKFDSVSCCKCNTKDMECTFEQSTDDNYRPRRLHITDSAVYLDDEHSVQLASIGGRFWQDGVKGFTFVRRLHDGALICQVEE